MHNTCLQVFLVFVVVALVTLGYCSDLKQSATYQDTIFSVCGKHAQTACALSILLYCFGTCITFLIIIGDQWEECQCLVVIVKHGFVCVCLCGQACMDIHLCVYVTMKHDTRIFFFNLIVFLFVDRDFYCNKSPFYMNRAFTIVVTSLLFILPMIFPRRIDFLKYAR